MFPVTRAHNHKKNQQSRRHNAENYNRSSASPRTFVNVGHRSISPGDFLQSLNGGRIAISIRLKLRVASGSRAASGIPQGAKLTCRDLRRREPMGIRRAATTAPNQLWQLQAHPILLIALTTSHRKRSPCWSTPLARQPSFRQSHPSSLLTYWVISRRRGAPSL